MQSAPKYLMEFDQLREGAKIVQGDERYARNPLKTQCMLDNGKCPGHRHLGKMSYPQDIWRHYETIHKVLLHLCVDWHVINQCFHSTRLTRMHVSHLCL